MLLNDSPLNQDVLNGGEFVAPAEPAQVDKVAAFSWRLRLLVGGVDWSARLVGQPDVDREEGAAGMCNFQLCLPAGPVTPTDWKGRTVQLDFIRTVAGVTTEARVFTGRVVDPTWSRTDRVLSCTCTDQLQQRVEALSIAQVDSLVSGYWSEDVFQPLDGRSHWDYAMERMETRAASLDCDAYGVLRVSSWYTTAPQYVFGSGTTVYDTLDVQLSDVTTETNTVEIEFGYRFPRLYQLNNFYSWVHPDTEGFSGIQGFCSWRVDSSELPTIDMIREAVSGSGQVMIGGSYMVLPPSGIYCDPPIGWVNSYTDLVLSAGFTGARRWVQQVTERYTLSVRADAAVAAAGEIIERISAAVGVDSAKADDWESEDYTSGSNGHEDLRDEPRRVLAIRTLLAQAVTAIVGAHRGTVLSWDVPTGWVLGLDLVHSVELNDQGAYARGKVMRLQHRFDLASGISLTTVSIAVMRGGGSTNDSLTPPAFSTAPPVSGVGSFLTTQLGGKTDSGEYNENLDGFSGQYDNADPSLEVFPRQFRITTNEIAADLLDEQEVTIPAVYRIAIPDDPLELY